MSFAQTYFTNDTLYIQQPNMLLLNNNKPYNGIINKSIANLYFHNSVFYPYEIYIYLCGNFKLNKDSFIYIIY